MTVISIADIARHGIVSDEPDHSQPPEAWTDALNMRFTDRRASRFLGDFQVMDPPTVAPGHLNSIQGAAGTFWFYSSAVGAGSKIYGFSGGVHADLSKVGNYTANSPADWTSTVFQGVPIFNSSNNAAQFLPTLDLADDFEDLPAWPANLTVKALRTYKNYLVAMNTTVPGDIRPHRVLVSDSAEPGTLPSSWDETDPAVDALEFDLSDVNAGDIIDGMALRDMFAIYKSESTWIMRHVGGQLIMAFDPILQTSGILAKRCACPITLPIQKVQVQFVKTGEDLGIFNGQDFESIVDRKLRKRLNSDIDPQFYTNAFVVDNPAQDEAWFCYPENGQTYPTKALVWNYRRNTLTFREFNGAHAATGVVESESVLTWTTVDAATSWESSYPLAWSDAARRKLIIADQTNTKLLQADFGNTFNGAVFDSFVERTCLAIIGQDREGNPELDYQQRRLMKRIWPKVIGNPVNVYFGGSDKIGGAVSWQAPMRYDPASEFNFVDPEEPLNVRLPALRFESIDGLDFAIEGYDIDIEPLGDH